MDSFWTLRIAIMFGVYAITIAVATLAWAALKYNLFVLLVVPPLGFLYVIAWHDWKWNDANRPEKSERTTS